jgi:hypothetical protein
MPTPRLVRNASLAGDTAVHVAYWSPGVTTVLADLLQPYLEAGESLPDLDLLQKLIARLLADRRRDLEQRDDQNATATAHARKYRRQRDQAAKELRETLRTVRFFLDTTLGRGEGAKVGIGNGLSTMSPPQLLRTGHLIAGLLAEPKMKLEGKSSVLSVAALAEEVRQKTATLEEALDRLAPQAGRERRSRTTRTQSNVAAEKALRRATALLSGLYQLAEHDRLAKAVRPRFRRRKKAQPPAEAPAVPPLPILDSVVQPGEVAAAASLGGLAKGESPAEGRDEEDRV